MKSLQNILLYRAILVMALILSLSNKSFSQEKGDKIPDGTQGEELEVVETDTLPSKWRGKRWRLFPGRYSTLKIGGGFLYEYAGYVQDSEAKRQMDSIGSVLEPSFSVRDFRLTISGQLKTKRTISWKLGFMYDDASRAWFVRESGVMVGVPEFWGNIFVGRTKEGFSLNKVMVGYAGWTMERQMALDVIPILADGIKWLGFLPKPGIFWNLGVYNDWLSEGQSFSTYKWQTAARIGWLPINSPADKTVLHLGFNYRYGRVKNDEIRVRSRPEADPAFHFIDTGKFPTEYSNQIGGEAYYRSGPLMFGSEFYFHRFHSVQAKDPVFFGGDIMVSYILTGESRPYHTATSIFGFVQVARPVFKGGPGAWEVLFRASTLDLDAGTLQGGKFWRITPTVTWYLNNDIRLILAYGYGVLDRYSLQGTTQFFQGRIMFTLL